MRLRYHKRRAVISVSQIIPPYNRQGKETWILLDELIIGIIVVICLTHLNIADVGFVLNSNAEEKSNTTEEINKNKKQINGYKEKIAACEKAFKANNNEVEKLKKIIKQ